ncbi:MAG: VanZ family protein [Candidatus Obscuribacterales bacterium]|nr:VanZ family protein [Candidatus Obscuribacterales bacterium]
MTKIQKRILRGLLLLAWLTTIYILSDQPNSNEVTKEIFGSFNYFVRKGAHMTEYAVLFFLFLWFIHIEEHQAPTKLHSGHHKVESTHEHKPLHDALSFDSHEHLNLEESEEQTQSNSRIPATHASDHGAQLHQRLSGRHAILIHHETKIRRFLRLVGLPLLLTIAYALTDEWHQAFVPGRSSVITDVIIDSTGACLAALVCWFQLD